MKKKRLTIKERKFVVARIAGDTQLEAYKKADYAPTTKGGMKANAHKVAQRPHIQQAIDTAMEAQGMNPEYLVGKLKEVVDQDKEIGAKRLAIMDGLQLQGWRKDERPTLQLNVKNAFFNNKRTAPATQDIPTIEAQQ